MTTQQISQRYTAEQIKSINSKEPILNNSTERFNLFPLKYKNIWAYFKLHEKTHWIADEVPFSADLSDWENLDKDEKYFIKHVLAFFANADQIVVENLMSNFSSEVQIPEARAFYSIQGYIEQVHSETYSRLIDTLITDKEEKEKLFDAIQQVPCVSKKASWAMKWMNPETAIFAERLVAFAVVEGVFFSGSFCAIFWAKSKGKMVKALGFSNEFIARDENLHCNFAIALYNELIYKLPESTVHEIFMEAVEIEKEFIIESLPCRLIGMNSDLMIEYIKFVANHWIRKLGYNELYAGASNPFPFMVMNDLDGKANFFEINVSNYQKPYTVTSSSERVLNIHDDF